MGSASLQAGCWAAWGPLPILTECHTAQAWGEGGREEGRERGPGNPTCLPLLPTVPLPSFLTGYALWLCHYAPAGRAQAQPPALQRAHRSSHPAGKGRPQTTALQLALPAWQGHCRPRPAPPAPAAPLACVVRCRASCRMGSKAGAR